MMTFFDTLVSDVSISYIVGPVLEADDVGSDPGTYVSTDVNTPSQSETPPAQEDGTLPDDNESETQDPTNDDVDDDSPDESSMPDDIPQEDNINDDSSDIDDFGEDSTEDDSTDDTNTPLEEKYKRVSLCKNIIELYDNISSSIETIVSTNKQNTIMVSTANIVIQKLRSLQDLIHSYLINIFKYKTYEENLYYYEGFLETFKIIIDIIKSMNNTQTIS